MWFIFIKFMMVLKNFNKRKRDELYRDAIKFVPTRVNLDLASYTNDIWSH